MAKGWEREHAWSRRFLPEMKRIIGEHLIVEAPVEEDEQRNTDLVVLRLDAVRVACRVRQFHYLARYGDEFTIRAGRQNGNETELQKVIAGWGHYILYAFADERDERLAAWILGDLNKFRTYWSMRLVLDKGRLPGFEKHNGDGSSSFRSFKVAALPSSFVVARKRYAPLRIAEPPGAYGGAA